jgi:hypothetical protein
MFVLAGTASLHAQDAARLGFDGELRLRGEWDGRSVAGRADAVTLSRVRLAVRADLASWIRAYAQLQDARAWGTEGSTVDGSADLLDMHQAFAELGTKAIAGRLGRQEMALGDERLIGTVGWSNTGRVFDGVRLLGETSGIAWQAFWMNVVERDAVLPGGTDPQLNQGLDNDGWLIGGFAAGKLGGTTAELTAIVDRRAVTEESYTLNLRAHGRAGVIMYEAAGAYQFGPDRGAYFASGKAGVALGSVTVVAQADYLSGDDDLTDGESAAFHTLYATNHKFYGIMDYFLALPGQLGQAGLMDAMARGSYALSQNAVVRLDVHRFAVAKERAGARALGTELDLVGDWSLHRSTALQLGGGVFLPEPLASRLLPAFATGDEPTYWAYAQLTVRWP